MPRNGDIRSWFAGSQAASAPRRTPARSAATAKTPSRAAEDADVDMMDVDLGISQEACTPGPDDIGSLTSSPPSAAAPRRTFALDAVIAASDDEGDGFDSDGSALTDIGDIGAPKKSGVVAGKPGDAAGGNKRNSNSNPARLPETPRARRTIPSGEAIFSSPLTIQSKKHKYDMAALLRMNEKDEATRAFEELMAREQHGERIDRAAGGGIGLDGEGAPVHDPNDAGRGEDDEQDGEDDERKAARQLKERMLASAAVDAAAEEGDGDEGTGAGKMRVVRALERTDLSAGRKVYYFFEQTESDEHSVSARNPFPADQAKGVWSILAEPQDRAKHFQSGFPFDIQKMFGNMPDELFLWLLDEVCWESRRSLAAEYVQLLLICEDHVRRLVTPTLLTQLFRNLGATQDVRNLASPVTLRDEVGDPYRTRNWTCFEKLLGLLGGISPHLSSETRITTMQILLRLGMDNIAVESFGLTQEWRWAVDFTARSVPSREWANFCESVCASVYASTEKAALRYRAIALLGPVQQPSRPAHVHRRTLDLKRRLASVFFFDDPARAGKRPEDTVSIRAVIDRLEGSPFVINASTDYKELHALMMMLNIALGDASSQRVATTSPESCQDFDAEVDELAEGVKSMLTRVAPQNKGIHVSRIEAKSAMEMIRERLLYQVRTRPKPKIQGIRLDESEQDKSVPKQQDFMKGFFLKKGKKMAGLDSELLRPTIEADMAHG